MTELAAIDDQQQSSTLELLPAKQPVSLAARQMLMAHAEMMQTAHQLAVAMCGTQMVPARFRGKPDDGAAAILYGSELGLNPIQSLQRIIPIHGMPSLEARTMVALLKSRGYKVRTLEQSDEQVTVEGYDLEGERYVSQWTIARAVKAGYVPQVDEKTGKYKLNANGKLLGNEKYLTDPQAMLKAKAQAEVCRDMAPDILLGISYAAEELESERWDERPTAPAAAQGSAPLTVEELFNEPPAQQQPAEPAAEPASEPAPAEQEPVAEPATEPAPEPPASTTQNRKMHLLFRKADVTDREDRLTLTGHILGYHLDTSAAMTATEADKVINTLLDWDENGVSEDQIREVLNQATIDADTQTAETTAAE